MFLLRQFLPELDDILTQCSPIMCLHIPHMPFGVKIYTFYPCQRAIHIAYRSVDYQLLTNWSRHSRCWSVSLHLSVVNGRRDASSRAQPQNFIALCCFSNSIESDLSQVRVAADACRNRPVFAWFQFVGLTSEPDRCN